MRPALKILAIMLDEPYLNASIADPIMALRRICYCHLLEQSFPYSRPYHFNSTVLHIKIINNENSTD